jgi:uncharacterized protein YhfF
VDGIESLPAAQFGFPGEMRDRLVRAILDGAKTATASLLVEYEREPLPVVAGVLARFRLIACG